MKKPVVRPHNTIRTNTPSYFFGSGKAAATNPHTKKRKPSKLPTSLDELRRAVLEKAVDDYIYKSEQPGSGGLANLVKDKKR